MKLSTPLGLALMVAAAALPLACGNGGAGTAAPGTAAAAPALAGSASATGTATRTTALAPALAGSTSAARACVAADVVVAAGRSGAFHGQATQELLVRNRAADACFLAGAPQAQLPNAGTRARVDPGRFAATRLDLAPGQSATILIGTPAVCAGSGQPAVASNVQLTLPDGDALTVAGVRIDTQCGAPAVIEFDAPAAAGATVPVSSLQASIAAPSTIARGTVLTYRVTVANTAAAPLALSPCPSYTVVLGAGGTPLAQQTLLLDCQSAASVPANGTHTFVLRLSVPASAPAGTTKLAWKLEVPDGPVAGALISLG